MAKTHYTHPAPEPGPATVALCGWLDVPVTTNAGEVSCKRCLRALARGAHIELAPEPAFEPSGPYEVPRAARELDGRSLVALARSVAGVEERRYRWRSAVEALQALAIFRADGQGVGSTSNPARFERLPRGASDPTRQVTGQVDHLFGIDAARRRAFTEPRELTYTECACCRSDRTCDGERSVLAGSVVLTVEQQVQILDWAVDEHHVPGDPKPVGWSLETITSWALDRWGIRLTERHVTLVKSAGLRAVSAYLREIGEMAPAERQAGKESEMAVRGYDLSGWDEIEDYTGMSRSSLRRLSARETDPFPIHEVEGVRGYHAKKGDIDAWLDRNSTQRRAVGA